MNNRDELFEKMLALDERTKDRLLSEVFGRFEAMEKTKKYTFTPKKFFAWVEHQVKQYEEKQKNKQ